MLNTYYVWRRSDGYVDSTTYPPKDTDGRTFALLLTTADWSEAETLIREERED